MAAPGVVDPGGQIVLDSCFVGSGTGLDSARWTNGGGDTGNTQTVDTNRLKLLTGASTDRESHIWQTQQLRSASVGVLALVEISGTNGATAIVVRGTSTTWQTTFPLPNSSYGLQFGQSSGVIQIGKMAGASSSAVTNLSGFTWTSGSKYWARFEAIGHVLRGKTWADGSREPDWQLVASDTSNLAPGMNALAVSTNTAGAATSYFHNYTSYIPETTAPLLPIVLQSTTDPTSVISGFFDTRDW